VKIKQYNRSEKELEQFLIFSILSSGKLNKNYKNLIRKIDGFLSEDGNKNAFKLIEKLTSIQSRFGTDYLYEYLKGYDLPKNKKVLSSLCGILKYKNRLKKITKEELESVYGIGCKISSFFISNTRKNK
jgi:thermostable 8-oxoguanine DNA glycosylase